MKLILDREENGYVVRTETEVVSRFIGSSFRYACDRAERIARNLKKNLHITKSCLSDWYVGVPKEGKPVIFLDTRLVFASEIPENFRYVEGPYLSTEEAMQACLKMTGELGLVRET